jgi:biopolymer transport protein ExbD
MPAAPPKTKVPDPKTSRTTPTSTIGSDFDDLVEVVEIVDTPKASGAASGIKQAAADSSVSSSRGQAEASESRSDLLLDDQRWESGAATTIDASVEDQDDDEEDDEVDDEIIFAKRELPKDDMDMTPMVDVTFLLLIFFMITASFSKEKVIEEPPPLSDKASVRREDPQKAIDTVRVQVDEFNAYTIILPGGEDRQASSKQDLLVALDDARKEMATGANNDALQMLVEAHTDSIHAAVVAALDAGRDKGFTSFTVKTVEEFD